MSYGNRIKEFRKQSGLSQKDLADSLGISQVKVSFLENEERELKAEVLSAIGKMGVNIHWLITGEGEMFLGQGEGGAVSSLGAVSLREIQDTDVASVIRVPLLDLRGSAGEGIINYDNSVKRWVGLPDIFILPHNPNHVALLEAKGFSMTPTIDNRDMLLVAENETELVSEKVYIIRIAEELRVKRLVKLSNGNIVIWSENESYGREELTPQQWAERGIVIMAKVIKVIKDV